MEQAILRSNENEGEQEQMSLNDLITGFSRSTLRQTETVVTDTKGQQTIEVNGERRAVLGRNNDLLQMLGRDKLAEERTDPVVVRDWVPETFSLDEMEQAAQYLDEHGVVCFRDVLTVDQQTRYEDALWSWIRRTSHQKVSREDPSTWTDQTWPPSFAGIFSQGGLCHLPEVWEVREAAYPYFSGVYDTPALMSSFDGCNVMRPTKGEGRPEYKTSENWLHVDSDGCKTPSQSGYQGVVNVSGMDGTGGTGGCLQVVLDSHKSDFTEFMEQHPDLRTPGLNFTRVPDSHSLKRRMVRVNAPDRSLVIWKNETFHCNSPNRSTIFRHAQYVNFAPAAAVSENVREERVAAWTKGQGSTHWVQELTLTTETCQDYQPPELSIVGRRLVGIEPWPSAVGEGSPWKLVVSRGPQCPRNP